MKLIIPFCLFFSLFIFSCDKKVDGNLVQITQTENDTLDFKVTPIKLKEIIAKIISIDEVQSEFVGIEGSKSENYQNFIKLCEIASVEELIDLSDHKNNTVACYAALALAKKSDSSFVYVFKKFLNNNKQVRTFSGCLKTEELISIDIYMEYLFNISEELRAKDSKLIQLDSLILYKPNSHWLLKQQALENRKYSEPIKSQIVSLAFDFNDLNAVYYLCNWHKAEYKEEIKTSLLNYLQQNDFSKSDISEYYELLSELFSFKDSNVNSEITTKLKRDRSWERSEQLFKSLLEKNGIYSLL